MNARKVLGPALALLLVLGVAEAINFSIRQSRQARLAAEQAAERVNIRILTGSEKEHFLEDPELTRVMAAHGMTLTVRKAGSGAIVAEPDLKTFDVAFPAGEHTALKISHDTGAKRIFTAFYTPLAIASWKTLLPVLEQNGLVSCRSGSYYIDMAKLLGLMQKGARWKDLPGNTVYDAGKSILVTSTDIRNSSSAAMYLALASYVANGDNIVDTNAEADKAAAGLISLFSRQGYQESTSTGSFEDYTVMGIGKAPLVMIYEQQFLEYILARAHPNPDMVLLYPEPTILVKHSLVALTDNGVRFAQELISDPKLITIAHHYGFRTQDNSELFAALEARKFPVPHTIVDVVDPPAYDILEKLISQTGAGLNPSLKEF